MKKRHLFWLIPIILIFSFILLRNITSKGLDDVTPQIPCEENYLENLDTLWIIPLFNNHSIAENKTWCEKILSLNKTLGMHGVYHTYNEFYALRNETYIQEGITEFEKCFGFKPKLFEAPQLALSKENKNILEKLNLEIKSNAYQISHKIYHCNNTGKFSNRLIDFI